MALSIGSIVSTALALLNSEGLDKVTTRRIAELLGVQGPALYRHVRSKQHLLGEMYAQILSQGLAAMCPTSIWQEWLKEYARTLRQTLLLYRDSVRLVNMNEPADRTQYELVPAIYKPLTAAGIPSNEAMLAEGMIAAYTLGWVTHEQNPSLRHILAQFYDLEEAFEAGVNTIIAGLELRFAGSASLPPVNYVGAPP